MSAQIDHYLANDPDFLEGYNNPHDCRFELQLTNPDGSINRTAVRAYIGQLYRRGYRTGKPRISKPYSFTDPKMSAARDTWQVMQTFSHGLYLTDYCWESAFEHAAV